MGLLFGGNFARMISDSYGAKLCRCCFLELSLFSNLRQRSPTAPGAYRASIGRNQTYSTKRGLEKFRSHAARDPRSAKLRPFIDWSVGEPGFSPCTRQGSHALQRKGPISVCLARATTSAIPRGAFSPGNYASKLSIREHLKKWQKEHGVVAKPAYPGKIPTWNGSEQIDNVISQSSEDEPNATPKIIEKGSPITNEWPETSIDTVAEGTEESDTLNHVAPGDMVPALSVKLRKISL